MNVSHIGHSAASVADLIIMKKLEVCKKRVLNEKLPLQQLYREEMVKALSEHKKPEVIARKIPQFDNKNGLLSRRRQDTPKLPVDLPAIKLTTIGIV